MPAFRSEKSKRNPGEQGGLESQEKRGPRKKGWLTMSDIAWSSVQCLAFSYRDTIDDQSSSGGEAGAENQNRVSRMRTRSMGSSFKVLAMKGRSKMEPKLKENMGP